LKSDSFINFSYVSTPACGDGTAAPLSPVRTLLLLLELLLLPPLALPLLLPALPLLPAAVASPGGGAASAAVPAAPYGACPILSFDLERSFDLDHRVRLK